MLSKRDLQLAEFPRHGSLRKSPSHLHRCGATGSAFSHDPRSAQRSAKAMRSVSVSHQQTAKRQHAGSLNSAGQQLAEASVTQHSSDSKVSGRCLPDTVMDLQASTGNGAEAAGPTEQGQSEGTRKAFFSPPQPGDSTAQSNACTGSQKPSTELALWCFEWANTRWRASFFFFMASVAFVVGSGASLQTHIFAGRLRPIHARPENLHG